MAQAHELDDGRSIVELGLAVREGACALEYPLDLWAHHDPRHLRDIFVTEYGAADLRGLSDRDRIAAMLNIADSRFQEGLLAQAKAARKIEKGYEIPADFRNNTPERIEAALGSARRDGSLPVFPFGTEMTAEERSPGPLKSTKGSSFARVIYFIGCHKDPSINSF